VAIPFGITVDFDSLKVGLGYYIFLKSKHVSDRISVMLALTGALMQEPHTVTLRERDSTSQVRIAVDKVSTVILLLIILRRVSLLRGSCSKIRLSETEAKKGAKCPGATAYGALRRNNFTPARTRCGPDFARFVIRSSRFT
jgi:hypothetical protein